MNPFTSLLRVFPQAKKRNGKALVLSVLVLVFLFRFLFGLACPSVVEDDDEVQTYLIGLKSYTTQTWPYFGTDLQGGTVDKGQMPGALEGLLVRAPLEIWPAPEAPYLFLNLLTFAALTFLAWYCCRRLPKVSPWFVFGTVYLLPWTTHFSTIMMNQSFAIVGAVLFWVGFLESVPAARVGAIPAAWANVWMGFGTAWVMQLHMSWVMFAPFLLGSLYFQWRGGAWKSALAWMALGSLPILALLVPTWAHYGFNMGRDIQGNAALNTGNATQALHLLARLLSFACFELPRFLGEHTHDRVAYLTGSPWLLPAGAFLWVLGYLQALVMAVFLFRKEKDKGSNMVRWVTLGLFLTLYLEFLFSRKPPSAHRYYEALPLVVVYSFHCWRVFVGKDLWRTYSAVFLAAALFFQTAYGIKAALGGTSVYLQYRAKMAQAIAAKDYRLLAERRPAAFY